MNCNKIFFSIIALFSFSFSFSFSQGINIKNYPLDSSKNIIYNKTIISTTNSKKTNFEIVKKFMFDYYSDSRDKMISTDEIKLELKSIGSTRVDKDGFFPSDEIRCLYNLDVRIDSNIIYIDFTLEKYDIDNFSDLNRVVAISNVYPFNSEAKYNSTFELAFENSIRNLNYVFNKINKCIQDGEVINEYLEEPKFKLNIPEGNYIVNLNKDTIRVEISKITLSKIICVTNGLKVKYKAKNILSYISNGEVFDSGKVNGISTGIPRWIFFQKIMSGNLNLYSYVMVQKSLNRSNTSGGVTTVSYHYSNVSLNFIRLNNNSRGKFVKIATYWRRRFKKVCGDCAILNNQILKDGYWMPNYTKYVNIYNAKCSTK